MITRGAAAVLVVLTALVTACAAPIAGAPHATASPPGGGLPLDPEQVRLAELSAQVRSWDICAMHDVDAAARATGYVPDELLPDGGPGVCRLVTTQASGIQRWDLRLDVVQVPPTEGGRPVEVGGVQMRQVGADDSFTCGYSYPIEPMGNGDEPWGIVLWVSGILNDKAPCDVARDYATAIAPRLADPPLRSAGATTPALEITASDPCAVAAAIVPAISGGGATGPVEVADLEPYLCSVLVDVTSGAAVRRVRGSVEFALASASEMGSVTIGGFPGARGRLGIDCEARFAPFDTPLAGNPQSSPSIPVIKVIGECDRIDALATAAAGAITPATADLPRTDARALGDLDPPPTAESVGSPFDPCTVVGGWQAYPADVQPAGPGSGEPVVPGSDDPFKIACKFNAGDMFSLLAWGMPTSDGFSADPAERRAGAVAAQYAGKPGVEEVSTNTGNGAPTCYSAVQISQGVAAIVTTLSSDPCRVNRAVLEQLARKVP